jgi:HD-like signal output (HDOD) protein
MQLASVEEFVDHIQNELANNRLILPTLPDVTLKVMDAVSKRDASAKELAAIILTDAALSAKLIRVANSPLYRGRTEITNVQIAVSRLGNATVRTVVNSLMMQQLFKPSSKFLEDYFKQIWEQNKNVATISRAIISAFVPHLDADEAMLAGLIHQIGKLPILSMVEKFPELKNSPSLTSRLLEKAHPTVGKMIMDSWDFPAEIKPVASQYNNFQYDSGEKADYVDVVQVAFLQSIADTDHPACRVDCSTVPAFAKLGLNTDIEVLEIEDVSDNVALAKATYF